MGFVKEEMLEPCEIQDCEELSALTYDGRPLCDKHWGEICAGIIDPNDEEIWKEL